MAIMNNRHRYFLLICFLLVLFILQGCASNNPPYKLDSGEQVILANGNGSVSCSWKDLLAQVDSLLDDVLPYTKDRSSGIDSMVMLHNKLEDRGIRTALVAVNVEANEPFLACITVETTDRGLVFLTLVPQSLGEGQSFNRSEYIQAVYLEKGEKIGFVEAKFALSGDYSWYLDYLDRFYAAGDFYNYLEEYNKTIEKNALRLDSIDSTNEEIRGYLDDLQYYTEQRRIAFNRRVERYNSYIEVFDAQVEDYNFELSQAERLTNGTSEIIYAIKEDYSYAFVPIVLLPQVIPNVIPNVIPHLPTAAYVDTLISSDDSYNQIPKPDRQSVEKFERITDDNFVVNDFKLWW